MMREQLAGLTFEIEYTDGVFEAIKKNRIFFSSVKNTETAICIQEAVEAIRKELPKAMKADGHWEVRVHMYGIDKWYKNVDGVRYIIDKMDAKVTYRKWVDTLNIYDVDCEVRYINTRGFDRPKMLKELCERLQFDATALVLDYGRVEYNLSI